MNKKITWILVLTMLFAFSGVAMAAQYIGETPGTGNGGVCPQFDPWTKIDMVSGSEVGAWGSFDYDDNTLNYEVNANYTLYLCIKYARTNDGWIIEGPESGSLVTVGGNDISHVSWYFVYTPTCEWIGETAWADGDRYTEQGNWATYTHYVAGSTVTLYAGQTMEAGTVHFSAVDGNGYVTITINLNDGWRLEAVEESVKIQGYDVAPSGNPSPGQFTTYKGEALTVTVPAYAFYGIHLDVEWESCE